MMNDDTDGEVDDYLVDIEHEDDDVCFLEGDEGLISDVIDDDIGILMSNVEAQEATCIDDSELSSQPSGSTVGSVPGRSTDCHVF